ncbi:MAG: SDR family oxidoreductase [Methyloceanibacter sp.]|nr:SDR family oxidoreductase [Methyloceanibacter sp.]
MDRYGPWAVITGASDGIGRAIATELAAEGFSLVLVARRKAILSEFAEELGAQYGTETRIIDADLGSNEGTRSVEAKTKDLDVGLLVAAAGFGTSGPFVEGDVDTELDMIAVNCGAIAALVHVFARRLVERGRGGIVLMSSLVAFQGVPRATNYSATKAYVQSFAEGLAVELSPYGVDVVASAPGPVRSGFDKRAGMTLSMAQTPEEVAKGTLRALGRRVTVRPGFLAWALETSLALLPRRGRTWMMTRVMAGMTGG